MFNLFELFSTFTCAKNIETLVNSFFRVKIINLFSYFTSSSLLSSGGMSHHNLHLMFHHTIHHSDIL